MNTRRAGRRAARTSMLAPEAVAWSLGALALGALPHVVHVPAWITGLIVVTGAWRLLAAQRGWLLPPVTIRAALAIAGLWGVGTHYHSVSGVEAGSALLLVMAAFKVLEIRTDRDRVLIVLIALFLLFAAFLRGQPVWGPAWLAVAVVGLMTALTQTVTGGGAGAVPALLRRAGRLVLHATPLALVLFLLFPRLPGPFWALPSAPAASTGLGDEMRPGDITALALSDAVAFRVRFEGTAPPPETLYWRGPVLEWFDGRTWRASPGQPRAATAPARGGTRRAYEVVLEPHGRRWLLALEQPVGWTAPRAVLSAAGQLLAIEPVADRMAYRAVSLDGAPTPGVPTDADLRLPGGSNPRATALARELRDRATDPAAFLRAVLERFRREDFYYTLTPPPLGRQPVDDFLFGTRQGFCEHYASAFAVLARAGGVPARVVAGYHSGEPNPWGNYWIVRQANAHAWVEAWVNGEWRRYDPTSAIAPERVIGGAARSDLRGAAVADGFWDGRFVLSRLALSWDAANAAWDRWVLAFGPEMQEELLRELGFATPDARWLSLLTVAGGGAALLLAAWLAGRRGRPRDPLVRAYAELCTRLAARVRPRRAAESPESYLRAVSDVRPDLVAELRALTREYLELRYAGRGDPRRARAFARRVRRFRPPAAPAPAPAAGRPPRRG